MSEPRPHPVTIVNIQARPLSVVAWMLFVALALLFVLQINQQLSAERWEYRIVSVPDENFQVSLDQLGVSGWEMVFARRATGNGDDPLTGKTKVQYEMIFKRRKTWLPRPTPQYIPE